MSSISFSQRLLKNEVGDSSVCFTIDQSRILLKQINRLNYLDSLIKLDLLEISALKSNLKIYESLVIEKDIQLNIKDQVIELKDEKISSDKLQYKNLEYLLFKEKVKKWIAIATGTVATGFMTYLWVKD